MGVPHPRRGKIVCTCAEDNIIEEKHKKWKLTTWFLLYLIFKKREWGGSRGHQNVSIFEAQN